MESVRQQGNGFVADCGRRHVMMMISLAFLAPDFVAAARCTADYRAVLV